MRRLNLAKALIALINLVLGILAGLAFLEGTLRVNPGLLIRGVSFPAPLDPPLITRSYEVRYSDGDQIYWRPDLVRHIPQGEDQLEAQVEFVTDEFGFRNRPPIASHVDIVVLGRSISLGAQQPHPWPELITTQNRMAVWNLSEPGSGIDIKSAILQRYALPRKPNWVIVEIQPAIDITTYEPAPNLLVSELAVPVLQYFLRPLFFKGEASHTQPIMPIALDIPNREIDLTCCLHYLEAQTVSADTIAASAQWQAFRQELDTLIASAREAGTCTALLYAPSKAELYFPLAEQPDQLQPLVSLAHPLRLGDDHRLIPDTGQSTSVEALRKNAAAGRDLLAEFSRQRGLVFIDPSPAMVQSILNGNDPFMVYDSHWNELGHQIVADAVARAIETAACP